MSRIFAREYPIRFSHCDPAGIVYFPRLFDLLHNAMEDWFTFGLDERFADLLMKKNLGTPTVSTRVAFQSPARLGDMLRIELRVRRLGRSAIDLGIDAFVADRPCFRADHTICIFSRETHKALPIPDDLRERMEAYVEVPLPT